jgi:hypothetical protein
MNRSRRSLIALYGALVALATFTAAPALAADGTEYVIRSTVREVRLSFFGLRRTRTPYHPSFAPPTLS